MKRGPFTSLLSTLEGGAEFTKNSILSTFSYLTTQGCPNATGSIIVCYTVVNIQVLKTFFKMLKDVGMAVPKNTETRCRDGSVQALHVIQRLHK